MKKRHRGKNSRNRSSKKQAQGKAKSRRHPFTPRHRDSGPLTGFIEKNARGFAFILPEERGLPDAYLSASAANYLMNGDRVEYRMRRRGPKADGEVTKVLERAHQVILGKIYHERKSSVIETSEGEVFTTLSAKGAKDREWVMAEIVHYPDPKRAGIAKVSETVGPELRPEHDNLVAIARFGLPVDFPKSVESEAEALFEEAANEIKNPHADRKDLRHLPFVTIDGEDAKDFDDAVLVVERSGQKAFTLYVAIADVSFFVRPHSALDKEAIRRSTSVYLPGTCLPMLPESLSNDLCSLNPATDKLSLVAEMEMDKEGRVQESHFYPAIIKTAARLTYTQVHRYFAGEPGALPETVRAPLDSARRLFKQLLARRQERGVLDFQFPECRFELGPKGEPLKVYSAPVWESHKLIEEFMIAANSAVAKALRESTFQSLYRVHESPEVESIEELNYLMRSLGFSMTLRDVSPKAFSAILAATTGKKGAHTLHKAILRAQKQARYEPDPKGHFGLALRDYTHFTSPIRRYPDLVVHHALKHFIYRGKKADKTEGESDFTSLGEITSQRERRAMEAERFVVRRKQCWFMKERIGEKFPGVISGVIAKGVFVEIGDLALDGFVPIESLGGLYEFEESRGCMRRRPGHTTLSIGDKLNVIVDSVSVEDGQITLAAEETAETVTEENDDE